MLDVGCWMLDVIDPVSSILPPVLIDLLVYEVKTGKRVINKKDRRNCWIIAF